ncbi:MAG: hypothetical protein HOJ79_16740 [Nitrospina sp.]|nr:hypothetical protein [Nitrospina sp.]
MSYQILIFHLILSVFLTNCASGTNPYFNNKNTLGLLGGAGGAAGGHLLCKNCKGVAKVAAIGGGALLGMLAGSSAGAYFDNLDRQRNIDLIKSVAETNRDNEVSTTSYQKSWKNPNTGKIQDATITQSAVPLRTYQNPNQRGVGNSLYASNNSGVCRDLEITVTITADGAPPTSQQYTKVCRTEQGWKQLN